jgi:hypothetical protein
LRCAYTMSVKVCCFSMGKSIAEFFDLLSVTLI